MSAKEVGDGIAWADLTVPDADSVRDFYSEVVGWRPEPVDMGGYTDFNMVPPHADQPVAGICHARGSNAGLPPQWLIYLSVADLNHSLDRALALGAELLDDRRQSDGGGFCILRDPAGAVVALYQPAPQ